MIISYGQNSEIKYLICIQHWNLTWGQSQNADFRTYLFVILVILHIFLRKCRKIGFD